jgi:hypothetical protein
MFMALNRSQYKRWILGILAYFVAMSQCFAAEALEPGANRLKSKLESRSDVLKNPPLELRRLIEDRNSDLNLGRRLNPEREDRIRDQILKLNKGGVDGSGGGSGVICFQTVQEAQWARDERGLLKPDYSSYPHYILVLDQMKIAPYGRLYDRIGHESPMEYIFRILDSYAFASDQRLIQKIKDYTKILVSTMVEKPGPFALLNDYSLSIHWPHCFEVQIGVRRSVMWEERGEIRSAFFLEVDPALFNSLHLLRPDAGFENEVAFFLHEALYQIAKELGQSDANQTHLFLNFLLAKSTGEMLKKTSYPKSSFHLNLCHYGFAIDNCNKK